jgi:hypothetical protein
MQTATTQEATAYRFPHFKRQSVMEDRSFTGGVRPGDPMPDFVLPTTTGRRVRKTDFVGKQPVLLRFGSFT